MAWSDFLEQARGADHAVQIYDDAGDLAESVAMYFGAGFAQGEPGVAIATAAHSSLFAAALAGRGWDAAELEAEGMLRVLSAEKTLEVISEDGMPSQTRFDEVVGGLFDEIAARRSGKRIRAFGEMVDLLSQRGHHAAALKLEDLWNELALTRNFSLLCGYRLDVFDAAVQLTQLPGVCKAHSHIRPAADPARLARAVDRALEEVLGPHEAEKVYRSVGEGIREKRVPLPQLTLMWISEHMPARAESVLAASRAHYEQPSAVATA